MLLKGNSFDILSASYLVAGTEDGDGDLLRVGRKGGVAAARGVRGGERGGLTRGAPSPSLPSVGQLRGGGGGTRLSRQRPDHAAQ